MKAAADRRPPPGWPLLLHPRVRTMHRSVSRHVQIETSTSVKRSDEAGHHISPKLQLISRHTAEQSLAVYRELVLSDLAGKYEEAMKTFPIR
jgi:hypothetical protein